MQQLLQDIGKLGRQRLLHLGTRIFRRDIAAYLDKLVQRDIVPVVYILLCRLYQLQFLGRIVYKRTQLLLLAFTQGLPEDFIYFPADRTRSIFQHMLESLVFTVNVGKKVLGTLGQIEYRFQIDYLGTCVCNGRESLRQQREKSQVTNFGLFCCRTV